MTKSDKYLNDILSFRVNHGNYVLKLCESLKKDLTDKNCPYYFDEKEANKYVSFIEKLSLSEGKWAGQPFKLENWQAFIIANIFGWKSKATGLRRYNEVTIHVPKKNGKTQLASSIALAYAYLEKNDYAGQIYMAATNTEQANICFNAVKRTYDFTPGLKSRFRKMQYRVINNQTQTFIRSIAADAPSVEGMGASLVIFDEYHLQKDDELKDNLITGQAARENSLFISISTAGTDKNGPYYRHIKATKNIVNGLSDNKSHFVLLYELPDEILKKDKEAWRKEVNWKICNPNYGISVLPDKLVKEFQDALEQPHKQPAFITKHLNIWADSSVTWIDSIKWANAAKPIKIEDFAGKTAYVGIDLGTSGDFSALCVAIPSENRDKVRLFWRFYIPEDMADKRTRSDQINFRQWAREGFIKLTEGNATDYNVIKSDILELCKNFKVKPIAYDPAYSSMFTTTLLNDHGIEVEPFSQGLMNVAGPTKQFYEWIMDGTIEHDGNPVIAWMVSNVELSQTDPNGNYKIHKGKSKNKIDGVSAAINAVGRMLQDFKDNPIITRWVW